MLLLLLLLLAFPVSPGRAGEGDGGTADPMTAGVGARERALGGGVALAGGPAALGWNPALLAATPRLTLHAHFSPLPEGGSYEHVGLAMPWGPGVVGVGFTRLGTDGIDAYDAASVATGTLTYADGELGLGYGLDLVGGVQAGFLWRQRWQALGDDRAGGSGLDLGLSASPARWPVLRFGARLRGALTPSLALGQEADRLPRTLDLGLVYERALAGRTMRWNAGSTVGTGGRSLLLGAEAPLAEQLTARLGLADSRPRFGIGIRSGSFDLDYLVEGRDLGFLHGVSITAHLGEGAAQRLERLTESARAEGMAAERTAQELRVDDYRRAARRHADAGEIDAARRLWLAYQLYRPDDPEAAASLAELEQQKSAARRDSLRERETATIRARQLGAIATALEADELAAAGALLDRLPPVVAASAEGQAFASRLAELERLRVDAFRAAARRLEDRGRAAAAAAAWGRLLLLEPADAAAAAGIRRAEERLQDLELERADQIDDLARLALLVRAFQAHSAGEFVLSETLVDSLLVIDPGARAGLELKRRLERRTAPPAVGVTEDARARYIEGMRHFNGGRYADAISSWERILLLDPDNDSVRRNIDEARARLGIERRSE